MVETTNQGNQGSADNSASIEEEEREHAVPDVELLTFQKQRSTPKVRLSEVIDGEEVEHLQIDDFAKHQEDAAQTGDGKKHYGMMKSGGEDKIIAELKRAGTLDSDGFPVGGSASPGVKLGKVDSTLEEEKKE